MDEDHTFNVAMIIAKRQDYCLLHGKTICRKAIAEIIP